ncbi:MAG TPA: SDR family NAD(P)-dependent oxidoreductase [Burkholderiaceae bacterium]|nr:SDR family NAD(P)-dependent oxidoreductase [Burkholderiaceae bacterium]
MKRFDNQVVIVTGGGGGMGLAFCTAFAREGARVIAVDRHEAAVRATCDAMAREDLRGEPLALDVADEQSVRQAFQAIAARHGRIDVLVNGAGIRPVADLLDQSAAEFDACMRVNGTGVFLCAREAARHMLPAGRGAIVNIASVNGMRAVTGMGAYCASKAAVISLTQTMASEWGPRGVRVNAILPAQVETPMIAEQVGAERRRREERIPLGRYGKPAEIAAGAMFLASDAASFINGHPLALDGGYLAFGFRPQVVPQ